MTSGGLECLTGSEGGGTRGELLCRFPMAKTDGWIVESAVLG